MFIYSAYMGSAIVAMVVNGAPPGPLGRLFVCPPNEVTEVPDIAGREMIIHLSHYGVVAVKTTKTRQGIEFDEMTAKSESLQILEGEDRNRFMTYINSAIEDRVSKGKIVPPPPPGMVDIMHRRGWKVEDYGIRPIGMEPAKPGATTDEVGELRNRLSAMEANTLRLTKLLEDALGGPSEVAEDDNAGAGEGEGEEVPAGEPKSKHSRKAKE